MALRCFYSPTSCTSCRHGLTLTPTTAMLTFTPSTWNRTQRMTVAAGNDGEALNDSARLTH